MKKKTIGIDIIQFAVLILINNTEISIINRIHNYK